MWQKKGENLVKSKKKIKKQLQHAFFKKKNMSATFMIRFIISYKSCCSWWLGQTSLTSSVELLCCYCRVYSPGSRLVSVHQIMSVGQFWSKISLNI